MFRIPRDKPWPPAIDLTTVRDTLAYMQDDMARVPGLEKVADALARTLDEIDAVKPSKLRPLATDSPFAARFLPWR